jgi:hypothetical protein
MSDWASTERLHAEVILAEGLVIEGDLHLQVRVAHHDGPETPLELLNREDAFLPVSLPGGGVTFVAKGQVAVVACRTIPVPDDPARAGVARRIGLEVMMAGGDEYRGWASVELPPTRTRALDYLNSIGQFFSLHSDGVTWFVHRDHVRAIRPND